MTFDPTTKLVVAHLCRKYLPLSETFIYRYLSNLRQYKPIVLANTLVNEDLFPLNSKLYACTFRAYTLPWLLTGFAKRLFRDDDVYRKLILRSKRAKLLHAHFGPVAYQALNLKKTLGLPLITSFYGADMSVLPNRTEWRENYKELFEEGELFLVEGTHMRRALVGIGCPEEKIRIQHIAIDVNQFSFRQRLPKTNEKVTLFFCGRFTEKKGLMYCLMAFERALSQFPDLELRIVGDGELRKEVEGYVHSNRLESNVTILGMQPHSFVAKEMAQADIFLQPSVTARNGDSEGGAPTIILEAQASGVPVLTTYHADIPEITVPGKSALLSKEKDWRQLADNLIHLLKNQDSWAEMGEYGRQHVEAKYNILQEVKNLEGIYSKVFLS